MIAGDSEVEVAVDPDGDPLAVVFHTISDPYVGHLSLFRVLSGTIRPDDHLTNTRTGGDERLHGLFTLRGKEHVDVPAVVAGDLGVVAKLNDTRTGDVLAPKGKPVRVAPASHPPAVAAVALLPRTQSDEDKLGPALGKLCEEDPTLRVERSSTGQLLLRGVGDVQLAVALDRLPRRFGVGVDTEPLRVAYRGDDHRHRPRPRAGTRSRPAGTGSSPCACSGSSRSSGAPASSSPTRSSAGPSRRATSRRCRRASRRRWPRAAPAASPSSTSTSPCSTARSTRSTRPSSPSSSPPGRASATPSPPPGRSSSSRCR